MRNVRNTFVLLLHCLKSSFLLQVSSFSGSHEEGRGKKKKREIKEHS